MFLCPDYIEQRWVVIHSKPLYILVQMVLNIKFSKWIFIYKSFPKLFQQIVKS